MENSTRYKSEVDQMRSSRGNWLEVGQSLFNQLPTGWHEQTTPASLAVLANRASRGELHSSNLLSVALYGHPETVSLDYQDFVKMKSSQLDEGETAVPVCPVHHIAHTWDCETQAVRTRSPKRKTEPRRRVSLDVPKHFTPQQDQLLRQLVRQAYEQAVKDIDNE